MQKPKVLWIGDAVIHTGFARVTHSVLPRLMDAGWDVAVLGVNYAGFPHKFPYNIWPALSGGDVWGLNLLDKVVDAEKPDVVLVNNDPWNVVEFVKAMEFYAMPQPLIGYMPVDGRNMRWGKDLGGLAHAIMYTNFGTEEMHESGYRGPISVIPHGVDSNVFRPMDQKDARAMAGLGQLPADAFIFGNVNRNSTRKRMDLSVLYFARWWRQAGEPDNAYLYLHASIDDAAGIDFIRLARYLGVEERIIVTNPKMQVGVGVNAQILAAIYNSFDVQISTAVGEGWGLTQHEGMACRRAQIVGGWSACQEWMANAAWVVPCSALVVNQGPNTIGGIPDETAFVAAMDTLYRNREMREDYARRAYARAVEPRFDWHAIGEVFSDTLTHVLEQHEHKPSVQEASDGNAEGNREVQEVVSAVRGG